MSYAIEVSPPEGRSLFVQAVRQNGIPVAAFSDAAFAVRSVLPVEIEEATVLFVRSAGVYTVTGEARRSRRPSSRRRTGSPPSKRE